MSTDFCLQEQLKRKFSRGSFQKKVAQAVPEGILAF